MFKCGYSSRELAQDMAVVGLGLTIWALSVIRDADGTKDHTEILSILYYLGIFLRLFVVAGSLFLLLRLRYPQSVVAGILLFGFWLIPEVFPDCILGLIIKRVNEIFGYFGGLFVYPIWRWQSLKFIKSNIRQESEFEPISLNLEK